ncbi:MAG TPA: GNAT family N-acetyltransferase [Acidimicrobiia bacterium]|nr:GNAT family N-acetyltransferase [Acidimicrobiia bacterium]
MNNELIRWGRPEDAGAISDVHVTAWQQAYRGILGDEYLDSLDRGARQAWWASYLSRGSRVHVAEHDGAVVGFCTPGVSNEAGWGEIFAIYVHPEHWGTGIGRELIVAGESTVLASGLDRALLWVLEDNRRARAFYERQGWSPGKPIRIENIGGVQVTEVRYEKDLREAP